VLDSGFGLITVTPAEVPEVKVLVVASCGRGPLTAKECPVLDDVAVLVALVARVEGVLVWIADV